MKSLLNEGFFKREIVWPFSRQSVIDKVIMDESMVAKKAAWTDAFLDYVECFDYYEENVDTCNGWSQRKLIWCSIIAGVIVWITATAIQPYLPFQKTSEMMSFTTLLSLSIIARLICAILAGLTFFAIGKISYKRMDYWLTRAENRIDVYEDIWPDIEILADDWMSGGDCIGCRDDIPDEPFRRMVYARPPITIHNNRPFREGENEGGSEVTDTQDQSQVAKAAEREEVSGPETDGDANPNEVGKEETEDSEKTLYAEPICSSDEAEAGEPEETDDSAPVKVDKEVSFDTDSADTGYTYDSEAAKSLNDELKYLGSPDDGNSESDTDTVSENKEDTVSEGENTPSSKTEEDDSGRGEVDLADEEDAVSENEDGDSESENLNLEHINKALDDTLRYFKETLNELRGA